TVRSRSRSRAPATTWLSCAASPVTWPCCSLGGNIAARRIRPAGAPAKLGPGPAGACQAKRGRGVQAPRPRRVASLHGDGPLHRGRVDRALVRVRTSLDEPTHASARALRAAVLGGRPRGAEPGDVVSHPAGPCPDP